MIPRFILSIAWILIFSLSLAEVTDDAMPGDRDGFYDFPLSEGLELQFPESIRSSVDQNPINSFRDIRSLENQFSVATMPYANDLMDCLDFGRRRGGGCGNCARGVRYALMCLHNKMANPAQMERIQCGRGAYAYAENQCMEKMGFENVYNPEKPNETRGNCMVPGTVLVYRGHKVNNHRNCNRYQNGNYCGHIEIAGTDNGFHDTVCNRRDKPRDKWGTSGSRILMACYQLKQWTDPNTWYR